MAPGSGNRLGLLWIDQPVRQGGLGASQYVAAVHGIEDGVPSPTDPAAERRLCDLLADLVEAEALTAAHDVSEGGLAVTLSEMAIAGGVGIEADLTGASAAFSDQPTRASVWFGETPGRVVVGFAPEQAKAIAERAEAKGIRFADIGSVGGTEVVLGDDASLTKEALASAHASLDRA